MAPILTHGEDVTQRRQFIGQVVTGAAAFAATACARAVPDVSAAPAPKPAHHDWDLSWTDRLATGAHKQVFDAPEISDGTVLHQARMFYVNYKDVYNTTDTDLRAVLVVRHEAIPMVLGDAAWAHYTFIGKKLTKLKDPTTGEWAERNPFLHAKDKDKYALVWPDGGLDNLIARGAIVLACNMAFSGFSDRIADRTKQSKDAVKAELTASLVPGVTLVPSGIFGVIRAEQGGCAYIRAT
jgi:intracellular sulfur oxidation DsrE/DsrF family protein